MAGRARRRNLLFVLILCLVGVGLGLGVWQLFLRPRLNFPRSETDYYMNDPVLGHKHRPHARRVFAWPEHKTGQIVMATNNLGMRQDEDVEIAKKAGTSRILVIGDSHLDGVVYNRESFANLLGTFLNQERRASAFEVLNTAAGYYGPDNYLAALDAYRQLSPDALLVGIYTGNDFLDATRFCESQLPDGLQRPSGYKSRLRQANERHAGAVAQLLNQACYFAVFPKMKSCAVGRVESLFKQLSTRCRSRDIELVVILIPTKWDVEPETLGSDFWQTAGDLKLDRAALAATGSMREDLARRLEADGIAVWDPTVVMRGQEAALFWARDYHLNDKGHALLATEFLKKYQDRLH